MEYIPKNYSQINVESGMYNPSMVKSVNNKTYAFWQRSLFQRACSVFELTVPPEWEGEVKDFLYWCLFKYGFVAVGENDQFGRFFQPASTNGYNFYYQPTNAIISNPLYKADLVIGKDCELLKLTPDYVGIFDIINYYAEKLSVLDNAINMSLINNKFAFILGARNKAAGEALKKVLDKVNHGEPAVIYDMKLLNDATDKDVPWQSWERNVKQSYLTTEQLMDFQTILNNFDVEIGIPVVPYQKKERMVTSEAESKQLDSTARSIVWLETMQGSIKKINKLFPDMNLSVELRFRPESDQEGDASNE